MFFFGFAIFSSYVVQNIISFFLQTGRKDQRTKERKKLCFAQHKKKNYSGLPKENVLNDVTENEL